MRNSTNDTSNRAKYDHVIVGDLAGNVLRDEKKVRITADMYGHLIVGCTRVTRQAIENLYALSNKYKGLPPERFLAQEGER